MQREWRYGKYIKIERMIHLGIKGQLASKFKQMPAMPVGEVIASGDAEIEC